MRMLFSDLIKMIFRFSSYRIDDFCKAKQLAKNGSKLVDMIDNLLSRIIELRAALTDSETAALDIQMHCVRSLMVRILIKLLDSNEYKGLF